jgi:hypothetical protein
MVAITIKHNFPEVQRQLDQLQVSLRDKVMVRAVNRTMEQGQTRMAREITTEFNIKARDVKARMKLHKANARGGSFRIQASLEVTSKRGRSLNVINFAAKQAKKGVSVKILRNGGRKTIKGAFIGNQGRTVFKRVGKERLPIKAVQTIDVEQMFNAKRINRMVLQLLEQKFPEVFEREAKYYTDRFNARRAGA